LRKLALNCEQIRRRPIVGLCPNVRIGASIDQLRINAEAVPRTLDGAFNNIRDPELFTDLAQVASHTALVLARARVADDPQFRHLGQTR
jgi:hypothetical protein